MKRKKFNGKIPRCVISFDLYAYFDQINLTRPNGDDK